MIVNLSLSTQLIAGISLDWATRTWSVGASAGSAWSRIAFSRQGQFELTSAPSAIWLWDRSPGGERRNILIIRDSPTSEVDATHAAGLARAYAPKDAALKDFVGTWALEAAAAEQPQGLSPVRRRILDLIVPRTIPCLFPVDWSVQKRDADRNKVKLDPPPANTPQGKYVVNNYNPYNKSGGTNCYTLPAFVAQELKRPFRWPATTGLPKEGRRYNAWVQASDVPGRRPQPGDLYALCTGALTDMAITHVGVIIDSSGTEWNTADMGQPPDGWSGKYNKRPYDPGANTLAGEIHDGKAPRAIAGWVDVDLLAK
ncbi:MAG TPA: hypothetical protein PK359_19495 [Burkholderiaceae bacterium]|nr:hypothetical protein [Burkholderiaceae bacterium]